MRRRGSYTIEASFLMPLIIGVIMFILYMAYFTHDRAILQKCAYTAALRGSQVRSGDQKTYLVAEENAVCLPEGHLLGPWELAHRIEVTESQVTVTYTGSFRPLEGILLDLVLKQNEWQAEKTASAYRIDEPLFIRRIRK